MKQPSVNFDTLRLTEHNHDALGAPQDRSDRFGNLTRGKSRGSNLIQERLKEVMIGLVN
jgi:hypothetical protein